MVRSLCSLTITTGLRCADFLRKTACHVLLPPARTNQGVINILQAPTSTSMSSFLQHSQSSTMENLIWNPLLPVDFNSWSRFFAKFRISFIVVRPPYHFGSSKDLYMCWYRQHYRKRHRRSSEECPSHKRAPVRRRDPSTLPSKLRYSRLPSHRQSAFTQKISAYLSRIISTSPLDHFSGL